MPTRFAPRWLPALILAATASSAVAQTPTTPCPLPASIPVTHSPQQVLLIPAAFQKMCCPQMNGQMVADCFILQFPSDAWKRFAATLPSPLPNPPGTICLEKGHTAIATDDPPLGTFRPVTQPMLVPTARPVTQPMPVHTCKSCLMLMLCRQLL